MNERYKLCFVWGCWAFFTTQTLEDQAGIDWDQEKYQSCAEEPDEWTAQIFDPESLHPVPNPAQRWDILRVAFDAPLETPAEIEPDSTYSVRQINQGAVPWLQTPPVWRKEGREPLRVWAGTTFPEFVHWVQAVYVPIGRATEWRAARHFN